MKQQNYKNKYPIVYLVYRDSGVYDRQEPVDGNFNVYIFHVAGFLIRNNPDHYVISREVASSHGDDLRATLIIPKEAVVHFKRIG